MSPSAAHSDLNALGPSDILVGVASAADGGQGRQGTQPETWYRHRPRSSSHHRPQALRRLLQERDATGCYPRPEQAVQIKDALHGASTNEALMELAGPGGVEFTPSVDHEVAV